MHKITIVSLLATTLCLASTMASAGEEPVYEVGKTTGLTIVETTKGGLTGGYTTRETTSGKTSGYTTRETTSGKTTGQTTRETTSGKTTGYTTRETTKGHATRGQTGKHHDTRGGFEGNDDHDHRSKNDSHHGVKHHEKDEGREHRRGNEE